MKKQLLRFGSILFIISNTLIFCATTVVPQNKYEKFGRQVEVQIPDGYSSNLITSVASDSNDNLYISSEHGIYKKNVHAKKLEDLNPIHQGCNKIKVLNKQVYAAFGSNIAILKNNTWNVISPANNWFSGAGIDFDIYNNELYLLTNDISKPVWHIKLSDIGNKSAWKQTTLNFRNTKPECMLSNQSSKTLWFGTEGSGIWYLDNDGALAQVDVNAWKDSTIINFVELKNHNLLASTNVNTYALYDWNSRVWIPEPQSFTPDNLNINYSYFMQDRSHNTWFLSNHSKIYQNSLKKGVSEILLSAFDTNDQLFQMISTNNGMIYLACNHNNKKSSYVLENSLHYQDPIIFITIASILGIIGLIIIAAIIIYLLFFHYKKHLKITFKTKTLKSPKNEKNF